MNNHKPKAKPKTKLEAKCLSLENKKILYIVYARGFVKTRRKQFRAMALRTSAKRFHRSGNLLRRCFTITVTKGLRPCFTITITMTIIKRLYQPSYYHHY